MRLKPSYFVLGIVIIAAIIFGYLGVIQFHSKTQKNCNCSAQKFIHKTINKKIKKIKYLELKNFPIFKSWVKHHPNQNMVYSPMSLNIALNMAKLGSKGHTRKLLNHLLLPFNSHPHFKSKSKSKFKLNLNHTLQIHNSLWIKNGLPINKHYSKQLKKLFKASIHSIQFNHPKLALNQINQSVQKSTHGQISKLLKTPLSSKTILMILNTIHFNAKWHIQFKPSGLMNFYKLKSKSKTKSFKSLNSSLNSMSTTQYLPYLNTQFFQLTSIPYSHHNYQLWIILPKIKDFKKALNQLSIQQLRDWQKQMNLVHIQTHIQMPIFKLTSHLQLSDYLKQMGYKNLFTPGRANFLDIISPKARSIFNKIYISKIIQANTLKINLKGTEASSATVIGMRNQMAVLAPTHKPIDFIVNHPFIYIIFNNQTHRPLFMGVYFG